MYAGMHGVLCLMNISRTRHRCRGVAAEETAAAAEAEAAGTKELHMGQMPKPNQAVQQCYSTTVERERMSGGERERYVERERERCMCMNVVCNCRQAGRQACVGEGFRV